MGSSTRKKSSKRADFQKPKLNVGKARPKPTNFTDTSFKSKGISLARSSLTTTPPTPTTQVTHAISHLSSRSDSQRRDALATLNHLLTTLPLTFPLPIPLSLLLPRLFPLLLDGHRPVRTQLLTLLQGLSTPSRTWRLDITGSQIEKMLLYIRAGMTHLSAEIRDTAIEAWVWVLETVGEEGVSCAGGWGKGLRCLCVVLGWGVVVPGDGEAMGKKKSGEMGQGMGKGERGWNNVSATTAAGQRGLKAGVQPVALLKLLALFLNIGLVEPPPSAAANSGPGQENKWPWMLTHTEAHVLPKRSNAYGYLNLFGEKRDEEGECYRDCEERRGVFRRLGFEDAVVRGLEAVRREGGEVGRMGSKVAKVLKDGVGRAEWA